MSEEGENSSFKIVDISIPAPDLDKMPVPLKSKQSVKANYSGMKQEIVEAMSNLRKVPEITENIVANHINLQNQEILKAKENLSRVPKEAKIKPVNPEKNTLVSLREAIDNLQKPPKLDKKPSGHHVLKSHIFEFQRIKGLTPNTSLDWAFCEKCKEYRGKNDEGNCIKCSQPFRRQEINLRVMGYKSMRSGEYQKAINYFKQHLQLGEEDDGFEIKSNITNSYIKLEEYREAEYWIEECFEECEQHEQLLPIASKLKADMLKDTGELEKAFDIYIKCLDSLDTNNINELAWIHFELASIYQMRGEYDKSLSLLQKSLQYFLEIDLKEGIALVLANIGLVEYYIGNIETAIQFLEKGYRVISDHENMLTISKILYELILILIEEEQRERSLSYIGEYEELFRNATEKEIQASLIEIRIELVKAVYLKKSKRLPDKMDALRKFQDINNRVNLKSDFRILCRLHIIDLLILELRTLGEESVLEKINDIVSSLQEIADKQEIFSLLVQISFFKAELLIIEGRFDEAQLLIDGLEKRAMDNKYIIFLDRIEQLKIEMQNVLTKMKDLDKNAATLREKIKATQFDSYLKEALTLKEAMKV